MQLQFVVTGFLVGTLIGLTGMGGGSLMTPILVLALGICPTIAVGTDLSYAAVTKAVGAIQHVRQGQVRIALGLWLALGSVPASIVGVGVIARLRQIPGLNVDRIVGHSLAVVLFFVAAMLLIQPYINRHLWPRDQPSVFYARLKKMRRHRNPLLVLVGILVGFLVSFTSVGGGSLVMFAMLLL